jgi:protein phosphatase
MDVHAATHTGYRRPDNEDRYLVRRTGDAVLLAVCDGMGGEAGGDRAAEMAVDALAGFADTRATDLEAAREESLDWAVALARVLEHADARIRDYAASRPEFEGMGTTATAALVQARRVYWAHVGDTRIYLLRGGEIRQVTRDHRFLQDLLDDGSVTPGEAEVHPLRHMLDQCVGCGHVEPDAGFLETEAGDRLLLCSDGLTGHLDQAQIRDILGRGEVAGAVEDLVARALEAGGLDNVTAVALEVA